MDKYMQMNIDTSTIRGLERDGGLPVDDLAKMVTPGLRNKSMWKN